ncbi:MAG: hypothetical protein JWO38_1479 [Gemmataceae bacterium]|nr:hypothetical protein [Gemmataceae bacterium]
MKWFARAWGLVFAAAVAAAGCSASKDEPKSTPEQQQQTQDAMQKYDKQKSKK